MRAAIFRMLTLTAVLFSITTAWAGDEGLYDKAPPEGSSFFRFINTATDKITPKINGKTYDLAEVATVKPYVVIPHGKVSIEFGKATTDYDAVAREYYTVTNVDGKIQVLKDPAATDKLKAQIILYNLTKEADVSLKTADGKVSVIGPVAASASADRMVNSVKLPFAIFAGEKKIADLEPIALERGASYAILLTGTADKPVTSVTKAEISTR